MILCDSRVFVISTISSNLSPVLLEISIKSVSPSINDKTLSIFLELNALPFIETVSYNLYLPSFGIKKIYQYDFR